MKRVSVGPHPCPPAHSPRDARLQNLSPLAGRRINLSAAIYTTFSPWLTNVNISSELTVAREAGRPPRSHPPSKPRSGRYLRPSWARTSTLCAAPWRPRARLLHQACWGAAETVGGVGGGPGCVCGPPAPMRPVECRSSTMQRCWYNICHVDREHVRVAA